MENDRKFMLLRVDDDGTTKPIKIVKAPECSLFYQEIVGASIRVKYQIPQEPLIPYASEQDTVLEVPLDPGDVSTLEQIPISLNGSDTTAYGMGDPYDSWFTACLGYKARLVYIGESQRPVLAHSPNGHAVGLEDTKQNAGWLSSITSLVGYGTRNGQQDQNGNADYLLFSEFAPLLVTSEASLAKVSDLLPQGEEMDMIKFRPNIVVDGEPAAAWDEDFWGELTIRSESNVTGDSKHGHRLALTANCGRCMSINIDYDSGRPGTGEAGSVLKKLMRDRRVDSGTKWSPIFGRYAFLFGEKQADVAVGDEIRVTRRNDARDVWAWPKPAS